MPSPVLPLPPETLSGLFVSWSILSFILLSIILTLFFLYNIYSSMSLDSAKISFYRGRTVILTGATSGTGLELAVALYRVGAKLILVGRREQALRDVISEHLLTMAANSPNVPTPPQPSVIVADLSLPEMLPVCGLNKGQNDDKKGPNDDKCDQEGNSITICNFIKDLQKITPKVDAVICCAGLSMRESVENMTGYTEQYIMNVNYFSITTMVRMLLQKDILTQGNIIVISSIQGLLSIPWRSTYSASKHALQAYFTSLRHELKLLKKDIAITICSPGYVNTSLSMNAICGTGASYAQMDENTQFGLDPEDVARLTLQASVKKIDDLWLCPPKHKLVILLQNFLPKLTNFFIRSAGKKSVPPTVQVDGVAQKKDVKKKD